MRQKRCLVQYFLFLLLAFATYGIAPFAASQESVDTHTAFRKITDKQEQHIQLIRLSNMAAGMPQKQDDLLARMRENSQSEEEAAKWMQNEAQKNNPTAQALMGIFYEGGLGVPQNDAKALRYYHLAADNGEGASQLLIGLFYEAGKMGLEKDLAKAVRYYSKAAEQDDLMAQYHLGRLYEMGEGVPVDAERALDLYIKAFRHRKSRESLDELIEREWSVEKIMLAVARAMIERKNEEATPEKINALILEMAQEGSVHAQINAYEQKRTDAKTAMGWMRQSAEKGDVQAQAYLGNLLVKDAGNDDRFKEGISWLEKAAQQDNVQAQETLFTLYFEGKGVAKDHKKALTYARQVAYHANFKEMQARVRVNDSVADTMRARYIH